MEIGVPSTTEYRKTLFIYNGLDSFASESKSYTIGSNNRRDTTIDYFTYNTSGKLIKDSTLFKYYYSNVLYGSSKIIQSYTYSGNKIYALRTHTIFYSLIPNQSSDYDTDTITLDTRGNNIEQITSQFYSNPSLNIRNVATQTFENNPSPFSNINGTSFFTIAGKNNVLKYKNVSSVIGSGFPSQVSEIDYTGGYTYNLFGKPTISNFVDVPSQGIQYRNTFYYITL